ncbi:50S ribosomal subunit protein L3 N(5)-glutamine methyltransferase [Gammaproteobacteria bacterium]
MAIEKWGNEAVQELRTIIDLVRWGASHFAEANLAHGHGFDNPWDEATHLVLHALHLPHDTTDRIGNARLTTLERRVVVRLFRHRVLERRPVAYLTKEAWFAGLPFYVDERVLIPRSPIAELIEKSFSPWLTKTTSILDIGTGSGCIAVACALAFPEAQVDAIDISKEALEVAQVNVKHYEVEERVHLFQSDLYEKLGDHQYDLIVSNPPYVPNEEVPALPPEYQQEPALGLAAGKEGIDIVLRILRDAPKYLRPKGILVVEVGNSVAALEKALPKVPFLWLDFEHGGGGVFLLTAQQIEQNLEHLS